MSPLVVDGRVREAEVVTRLVIAGVMASLAVTALSAAAPEAVDDVYTTPPGVNLRVDPPGVLANDTDSDEDPLMAILVDPSSRSTSPPRRRASASTSTRPPSSTNFWR